jgi:hypothetical protein
VIFLRVLVNLFQFNRTNWKAVLLCFLAASIFWVFNALNKEYTSNVKFPLRFEYDEEKASPLQELPASLVVNVSGNGWELFREIFGYEIPSLTIALEKPIEIKKIVGSSLPPILANQIGKLKINYLVTDTLYVQFDQKDKHSYKLFVDSKDISFKEGYGRISPIVVLPDSIQLQGPKSLLHKLPDSLVITLPGEKLNSNFRDHVPINLPNADIIKLIPALAEVMFEVDKVTVFEIKSKVEIRNLPKRHQATLSQDSVSVNIQVPITKSEDFKKIIPILSIDLKKIQKGEHVIKPKVEGVPSYGFIVRVDSLAVNVF